MGRTKFDLLHQQQLDRRLKAFQTNSYPINGGWIRNLREALGMSLKQLSSRLKITPQSLLEIERAEVEGRITVTTLRKVAKALGAEVRIAVIPDRPLSEILRDQAKKVATKLVKQTQTQMSLEDQPNSEEFIKQEIENLTEELIRKADRRIWDEE